MSTIRPHAVRRPKFIAVLALALVSAFACLGTTPAVAELPLDAMLEVTEIMFNPRSSEPRWEWFEVRNTGATAVDFDGTWIDDVGGNARPDDAVPNVLSTFGAGQNTVVPAGSLAVFYNGFSHSFDDTLFRQAWPSVPAGVPLIGVDFMPSLSNSPSAPGREFGFWRNTTQYRADTTNEGTVEEPDFEVTSLSNATFSFIYDDASPWPSEDGMSSIEWNGNGTDKTNGANWTRSAAGQRGAINASQVLLGGAQFKNSDEDFANPGINHGGTAPAGLLITEVMYNPDSPEADWEWVEVLNNTGGTLDLAGKFFDDRDDSGLTTGNIASGTLAQGEIGILYNDAISLSDIQTAWGASLNYIAVSDFSGLNNAGDSFGIWDSLADYQADAALPMEDRTFENALVSLTYENNENGWPNVGVGAEVGDGASIFLTDLGAANGNNELVEGAIVPADGAAWQFSGVNAGFFDFLSDSATLVPEEGAQNDNNTDDVGSPGIFMDLAVVGLDGDYDNNGVVDAVDYAIWRENLGTMNVLPNDPTGGTIGTAQYTTWRSNFGASAPGLAQSTPEPSSLLLLALGLLLAPAARRR